MSSVLEELKSSARDSIEAKQRMIEELIELQHEHEQLWNLFRDVLLDASSYARSVYQLTVAEAREAKSVDEVAKLWKGTHAFLSRIFALWQRSDAVLNRGPRPMKDPLFDYAGEIIQKLERASAQAYEFHA